LRAQLPRDFLQGLSALLQPSFQALDTIGKP